MLYLKKKYILSRTFLSKPGDLLNIFFYDLSNYKRRFVKDLFFFFFKNLSNYRLRFFYDYNLGFSKDFFSRNAFKDLAENKDQFLKDFF